MSPTVTIGTPKPACQFCEKHGLPILPLRYAVARKGMGNAPKLAAPFDVTRTEKLPKEKVAAQNASKMMLDESAAYYTARLLRPGYLYVFDEYATKWSAYVVTAGSYLFQFDPYAKPPPGGWSKPTFSCKREGDAMIARCITIENAEKATKIWLGFSDALWTQNVLDKHAGLDVRKAHMQCLDVSVLRKNASQSHVAEFSELASRVAEYAADAKALLEETQEYVRKLLPKPYSTQSAHALLSSGDSNAKLALEMLPALAKDLLATAVGVPGFIEEGRYETAAWAFSPHAIVAQSMQAAAMQAWGEDAAKPYRPAMIALDDPAGIAMELNGLVLQYIAEITAAPEYRWKYETATSISILRDTVRKGAVERESSARRYRTRSQLSVDHGPLANPFLSKQDRETLEGVIESAGKLSEHEVQVTGDEAWEDYAARIHEKDLDHYLATVQKNLTDATQHLVGSLDTPYVAWLNSATLSSYFEHNYDRAHVGSGEAYTHVARLVLTQASGRNTVAGFLRERLGNDPADPKQWPTRALALNNDALIKGIKQSATETSLSWNDIADKASALLLSSVAAGNSGQLNKLGDGIARLIHEIAGPLVNHINQGFDHVAGNIAGSAYVRMQVGLLGAIARIDNPDYEIVDLRGTWNRKRATRTLARALASLSGGDELMYRSGVREALDNIADTEGVQHPYRAILLLDKAEARRLGTLARVERSAAINGLMVRPEQFEEAMERSVGTLANLEIKAGIVGAIFAAVSVSDSFGKLVHATPGEFVKQGTSLAGGVSSLLGGVFETGGKAVKNMSGSAPRFAGEASEGLAWSSRSAQWLEGAGRWFGVIGGVIAAGLLGYEAYTDYQKGNMPLMAAHIVLTLGTAASAALIFFASGALAFGVIGLIIGLLVALAAALIDWLKDDSLQKWLNKSAFFGDHQDLGWFSNNEDYIAYENPMQQRAGLKLLIEGH
ncbi:hypothetical protein ACVWWQ_003448 [Rhodanobacter sp. TND4EL1]